MCARSLCAEELPDVDTHLLCRDVLVPRDDARVVALQRGWLTGRTQRIDVLTEYFLIGSLTSWRLAPACLLLT